MLDVRLRRAGEKRAFADRGASALEYAALLLVGTLVGTVLVAAASGVVLEQTRGAVCGVFGGECAGDDEKVSPPLLPPRKTLPPDSSQPPPSQEQQETESALQETQLGRDALQWVKDHGVEVFYRPGGGSWYDPGNNVFYIDTEQSPEERANVFVHEVNHAEHRWDPDPRDYSREEFIDRSIDEEVEGTIEAIWNNQQFQETRDVPDTLMQDEYEKAYNAAIKRENGRRFLMRLPPLTLEEAKALGERAGRDRVKQAFLDGEVVSSVDGDTYSENYGEDWDNAHG